MTNEEEFEKALQDYTSQHVTGSSGVGLIRKIGAHFYAARQPEIDALKAEVERLNRYIDRRHAMMAPAVREASIAAMKETK